jgi:hypothetical protein
LLYAAVLNLALVVIAVAGHHWQSAVFWLGLSFVAGIFAYRRPHRVALDPYDFREQVRLGRQFAAGIAVWGAALLVVGRRGHRGQLDAANILLPAPFFAVSLVLLALSLFWGTPRGQGRLLLLRKRAEAKQATIAAAVPPEPAAPSISPPPYFDK